MSRYVCGVCGFVYDEGKGMPEAGIAPGTRWEDLPEDWTCPLCGASKAEFELEAAPAPAEKPAAAPASSPAPAAVGAGDAPGSDMKHLSPLEASILCSNLARGCEKQYRAEEQALFTQLAEHFKSVAAPAENASFEALLARVQEDLSSNIPAAKTAATGAGDRGALRALTWSEKVSRILNSLLTRYEKEGDDMFANTGIYVCTICGFVYISDNPPELCPVCKVPSWKFQKVEGGAA